VFEVYKHSESENKRLALDGYNGPHRAI
jgi:hypothetical protein